MKKHHALDLSMLALSALMALSVASYVALTDFCGMSADMVTIAVSADTLSAVSGTDLPFHISIRNDGESSLRDGSAAIMVSREPKPGDFSRGSEFVVARSVVKKGIDLDPRSTVTSSFVWKVPTALPGGVYRADAEFSQGQIISMNPPSASARVLVSGENPETVFFVAATGNNDEPNIIFVNPTKNAVKLPVLVKTYSGGLAGELVKSQSGAATIKAGSSVTVAYAAPAGLDSFGVVAEAAYRGVPAFYAFSKTGASQCFDLKDLYPWAMLIGGLGVIMLILAHRKDRRNLIS